MSGRTEQDRNTELKISSMLQKQPMIIKEYANSFGNKTSGTKKVYIEHVINFIAFLKKEYNFDVTNLNNFKNLNYMHINSYMNYTKTHSPDGTYNEKGASCCATEFYAIKHFCKFLYRCRYVSENPCIDVEVPRDRKQHEIISLTPEEITIIKNNIERGVGSTRARLYQDKWKSRDLCLVMLGIVTGLRVSALKNIDVDDIDFVNKTLHTIEKGGFPRTIYLSDKIISIINEWLVDRQDILENDQCSALFISIQKNRISLNAIRDVLKKYTFNIPKHITPHKLRSTAATNLYESTGDIYLVADVLGHHNIQNTQRYAKISSTKREYAANKLSNLI